MGPSANWFIGLVVPEDAGWSEAATGLPAGMRRFHPRDLHLTVAFLGPCGPDRARDAWQSLARERHRPIQARADRWLALGNRRRPSAFGLGLDQGHAPAAALMADWGGMARAAAALPAERRAPLPHVTLAQPTRRGGDEARAAMAHWIEQAPVPRSSVVLDELALFTWAADRSQRLFEVVAQRPLLEAPPELEAGGLEADIQLEGVQLEKAFSWKRRCRSAGQNARTGD